MAVRRIRIVRAVKLDDRYRAAGVAGRVWGDQVLRAVQRPRHWRESRNLVRHLASKPGNQRRAIALSGRIDVPRARVRAVPVLYPLEDVPDELPVVGTRVCVCSGLPGEPGVGAAAWKPLRVDYDAASLTARVLMESRNAAHTVWSAPAPVEGENHRVRVGVEGIGGGEIGAVAGAGCVKR